MKTSTKIVLVIFVGILGLRVSQRVQANQLKPVVALKPDHSALTQKTEASDGNRVVALKPDHSALTQKTEASDGDGEADDATEPPENEQSEAKENEAKAKESHNHFL